MTAIHSYLQSTHATTDEVAGVLSEYVAELILLHFKNNASAAAAGVQDASFEWLLPHLAGVVESDGSLKLDVFCAWLAKFYSTGDPAPLETSSRTVPTTTTTAKRSLPETDGNSSVSASTSLPLAHDDTDTQVKKKPKFTPIQWTHEDNLGSSTTSPVTPTSGGRTIRVSKKFGGGDATIVTTNNNTESFTKSNSILDRLGGKTNTSPTISNSTVATTSSSGMQTFSIRNAAARAANNGDHIPSSPTSPQIVLQPQQNYHQQQQQRHHHNNDNNFPYKNFRQNNDYRQQHNAPLGNGHINPYAQPFIPAFINPHFRPQFAASAQHHNHHHQQHHANGASMHAVATSASNDSVTGGGDQNNTIPPSPTTATSTTTSTPLPLPVAMQCKFGLACTRPGCTFAHPSPAVAAAGGGARGGGVGGGGASSSIQCMYFPNCLNKFCTFYHPPGGPPAVSASATTNKILCRFYPKCLNPACPFFHPAKTATATTAPAVNKTGAATTATTTTTPPTTDAVAADGDAAAAPTPVVDENAGDPIQPSSTHPSQPQHHPKKLISERVFVFGDESDAEKIIPVDGV